MPEYTLTVLDTPGIQSYIFGSNRLRENIGASELVRRATETWPLELLKAGWRSNVAEPDASEPRDRLDPALRIETSALDAEVVYIGGGNAVLLFRNERDAKALVTQLSRKLLEYAPDLRLAAAHVPVDWDAQDLAVRVDAAMQDLAQQRAARPCRQPQLGLGVTAECRSTGLVATTTNAEHGKPEQEAIFPVSDAVAGKLRAVDGANRRLRDFRPDAVQKAGLEFPLDFDQFGRSRGEMSYIAVVHADGNEMGRFFQGIAAHAQDSRDYIERMREASVRVEEAASAALQRVIIELVNTWDDATDQIGDVIPLHENKLPFRPLVFGGDDVTFVCDGRLGLTLAARYLAAFEDECKARDLELYACAGVAVVKTHYPFARAYQLSQDLTGGAKRKAREEADGNLSVLDWHFATSGLLGDLSEIRRREYTVSAGDLYQRPLVRRGSGPGTWSTFADLVNTFKNSDRWKRSHNKVIGLREVLRQGPDATEIFLEALGEALPEVDARDDSWTRRGWAGGVCGYFDAIEALDFYVPLKEVEDADL